MVDMFSNWRQWVRKKRDKDVYELTWGEWEKDSKKWLKELQIASPHSH
jgi:hypothetical protein